MPVFAIRQLTPQVGNVHVDGAIERGQAFAQHFLAQQFARHNLAETLRQQVKQGEFGAGQIQYLAVEAGLLAAGVELQAIDVQRRGAAVDLLLLFAPVGTAQNGANARDQFAIVEGFRQIIIGAQLRPSTRSSSLPRAVSMMTGVW